MNLQRFCKPKTPAKDTLDVLPALPLLIEGDMAFTSGRHGGMDDIVVGCWGKKINLGV